ncbi:uncharacterized protein LOC128959180 [Oppia nitens]|uniref:uncharacterized protein LOC128959180 n=1 Tax=Oppia nitens TaxID=1686743 RepID=UPI0023DC747E|nr:uncharacterized protein LOC128959180 [Oppia nitens]
MNTWSVRADHQMTAANVDTECMTSRLLAVDESGSNLFVIGDRRNRFLVSRDEYDYYCSVRQSWLRDIDDYVRHCLPRHTTQRLVTRKLVNQMRLQSGKLCNRTVTPTKQLFANTVCINKVIDDLHHCMEDMIDYMGFIEHRVVGIEKLTHLCCSYMSMRNCSQHILNTKLKRSCYETIEWFNQLMSGYSLTFFKQFCLTQQNCFQSVCKSLTTYHNKTIIDGGDGVERGQGVERGEGGGGEHRIRDKSILPTIFKTMINTNM